MLGFRKYILILLIGAVGGVFAVGVLLPVLARNNFLGTAAILNSIWQPETVITKVEKETILIPQPNYFFEAVKRVEPSVVAIESFFEGRKIRSGSGVILTQDGLIATTVSVVPVNANIFQVTNQGKIFNAKVVSRDYVKNVALLSIDSSGLSVIKIKTGLPTLSQRLLVFSEQVEFGKDNPMIEEAIVSKANLDNDTFDIITGYDDKLFGAALIDGEGNLLGIMNFKNRRPDIIFSSVITESLSRYLSVKVE